MIKSIKAQLILMINKRIFWFSFYVVLGICLLSYVNTVFRCRGMDVNNIERAISLCILNRDSDYVMGLEYLKLVLPFVMTSVFAFSGFDEIKNGNDKLTVVRCGSKNYIFSKAIACFIGCFAIVFISLIINMLLCIITFPNNTLTSYGNIYSGEFNFCMDTSIYKYHIEEYNYFGNYTLPFLGLFINNPYIYYMIYILAFSIFSGILGVFSYACSFVVKKYKILIFLPAYIFMYIVSSVNNILAINYTDWNIFNYITYGHSATKRMSVVLIICVGSIIFSIIILYKKTRKNYL